MKRRIQRIKSCFVIWALAGFFIIVPLAGGSSAEIAPARVKAQSSSITADSLFAPGQIIIKFKDNVTILDEKLSSKTLQLDPLDTGLASINRLNREFRVEKITPLFKEIKIQQLKAGKFYSELIEDIKERFPQRTLRAPRYIETPNLSNIYRMILRSGADILAACARYAQDPNVEYAEPNYIISLASLGIPQDLENGQGGGSHILANDVFVDTDRRGVWSSRSWNQNYADMWGLRRIHMEQAWRITQGSPDIIVAVSDTGLDYNHPDIQDNIWLNQTELNGQAGFDDDQNGFVDDIRGYDFTTCARWGYIEGNIACLEFKPPDNDPLDDYGHGTHISGTIAAKTNNEEGVAGISWHAKIMPVRGLNPFGYTGDLADTIYYAANQGADIINMSWGKSSNSSAIADAVDYAYSLGVVLVAAAGNNGASQMFYPAALPNVIAVAAWSPSNRRPAWSNYGNHIDLAAPGDDILSLKADGTTFGAVLEEDGERYTRSSGTSMASPHVAGVAALILSVDPTLSSDLVEMILQESAEDVLAAGRDIYTGYGLVDARRAVLLTRDAHDNFANGYFSDDSGRDYFPDRTDDDITAYNNYPDGWHKGGMDPRLLDRQVSLSGPDRNLPDEMNPSALRYDLSAGRSRRNYDFWYVPVEEGKTYLVSGWIKTDNLINGGATFLFEGAGADYHTTLWGEQLYPIPQTQWSTGTTDWTRMTYRFTIPNTTPDTKYLRVLCYSLELPFNGQGPNPTGQAYFDNVSVFEVRE